MITSPFTLFALPLFMDPILQKISESSFTLSQLRHKVRILKEYLSHQIFAGTEAAPQFEPSDVSWLNSLGRSFLSQFNKDNIDQVFEKTESYLNTLKPLIIYIAFAPTDELDYQIGLFLRKNFRNMQIFEIRVDPNLIAGCALSFNGVYKDYSFRVMIESKREEILKSFKKFLQ